VILVDGLDECSDLTGFCAEILELKTVNIKVLCTSRPDRGIAETFCDHAQMEFDEALVQIDIADLMICHSVTGAQQPLKSVTT